MVDKRDAKGADSVRCWRLIAAASSGAGCLDKTKHDTPQILILSATDAPFTSRDA